jgi:uncharacterized protein
MKSRRIHEVEGQRTWVVVLDEGDEAVACLQRFAEKENVSAAQISAIGAFASATVAFWNWRTKDYEEHPLTQQMEVLSLLGDVALDQEGKPKLHMHAVLGCNDATTRGGHLLRALVRPTLEVVITESAAHLRRVHDPRVGLALIKL